MVQAMEYRESEKSLDEAMLDIYRVAKREAKYNAQRFLQMVIDHGGLETARMLIRARNVSEGYTALWERKRLDMTVEAMLLKRTELHPLFTEDELQICKDRLHEYDYQFPEENKP